MLLCMEQLATYLEKFGGVPPTDWMEVARMYSSEILSSNQHGSELRYLPQISDLNPTELIGEFHEFQIRSHTRSRTYLFRTFLAVFSFVFTFTFLQNPQRCEGIVFHFKSSGRVELVFRSRSSNSLIFIRSFLFARHVCVVSAHCRLWSTLFVCCQTYSSFIWVRSLNISASETTRQNFSI